MGGGSRRWLHHQIDELGKDRCSRKLIVRRQRHVQNLLNRLQLGPLDKVRPGVVVVAIISAAVVVIVDAAIFARTGSRCVAARGRP
jgi:hypothetical protein